MNWGEWSRYCEPRAGYIDAGRGNTITRVGEPTSNWIATELIITNGTFVISSTGPFS